MTKLIEAYRADRSLKNAQKLRAYDRKHPMASCFLIRDDADVLADAIHHANCAARRAKNEAQLNDFNWVGSRHHY